MIRVASMFLWLVVPVGLWLAIALWGTPHIVGTYRYLGNGYLPPEERRYIDCTYFGWIDALTVPAIHEHCPWVRFFRAGS